MKSNMAFQIGSVLGVVFIIMGFATSNSSIWILGFIFLGIGIVSKVSAKK